MLNNCIKCKKNPNDFPIKFQKETIATMDAYAKQGQEILRKKLQNDYESVDEVNKKIVENLVIAKKKQSLNLDAEKMAKQSIAVSTTSTSARKKDGTYFNFITTVMLILFRS